MLSAPVAAIAASIKASTSAVTELFGQVGVQDGNLGKFDVRQILAITFLKLINRVATLLDHFFDHAQNGGIVQLNSFVDFDLFDCEQR